MKKIFIIDGASGCGKTSVALKLQEVYDNTHYIASSTIRPMRPEEVSGREHFFLSTEEFNEKQESGAFLGFYDMYFNKYGIEKEKVLVSKKDNIILTYHSEEGTLKNDIKNIGLEFTTILILPDDEATLRDRIVRRNEKLEEHKIQARLDKYKEILAYKDKYDYVFMNKEGKLDELVSEILGVINK